jgi:hypothetical protein
MIPKGTSQIPHMKFKKENYNPTRKILVPTSLGARFDPGHRHHICFLIPFGIILVQMTLEIYE